MLYKKVSKMERYSFYVLQHTFRPEKYISITLFNTYPLICRRRGDISSPLLRFFSSPPTYFPPPYFPRRCKNKDGRVSKGYTAISLYFRVLAYFAATFAVAVLPERLVARAT